MSFGPAVVEREAHEIPSDGGGLSAALAARDRSTAELAAAVAEFDGSGEWAIAGYASPVAWLRDAGRMGRRDAYLLWRLGVRMRQLALTTAAWRDGRLSTGQVELINCYVIDRHLRLFAEHEAGLIPLLASLSVDETETALRDWRAKADAVNDGPEPDDTERCVAHLSETMDNRGRLDADLDAEGFALADTALGLADSGDFDTPAPERRGQALKDIFRFFLDNQTKKTGGQHRPHVNVMVKADTIGTNRVIATVVTTGHVLSPTAAETLLCDCVLHRVMTVDGTILDYGRSTRTPPVNLANALAVRDQGCRWYGCDRPPSWTQAHHVKWWTRDGGPTAVDNLVELCGFHHRLLHNLRSGFTARLLADGGFEVTTPHGDKHLTYPPGHVRQPELDWTILNVEDEPELTPFEDHLDQIENRRLVLLRVEELKKQLTPVGRGSEAVTGPAA